MDRVLADDAVLPTALALLDIQADLFEHPEGFARIDAFLSKRSARRGGP